MNCSETLDYIHSLGFFSHPSGLERIKAALDKLSNPQKKLKVIHIAGTNGKGSTATITAEILKAAGYKTGLFVSPYIVDFRERITVNGEYISKEDLTELSQKVINTKVSLTEFEFISAVGFLYFAKQNCDIVVLETGLGGRLDATNTCENVLVSAITKIGLDHTAILGETIKEIATEKCGIIKNNITVSYPYQYNEALEVIKNSSQNLIVPNVSKLEILEKTRLYNTFIYKGVKYRLNLSGEYQIFNCITAIEIIAALPLKIGTEAIKSGILSAFIPARLELISENPLIVLDGSHNIDGAETVKDALLETSGKKTAIIGMMKDKDVDEFLSITLPLFDNVLAVKPTYNKRALPSNELSKKAMVYNPNVTDAENIENALHIYNEYYKDNSLFILGSLYLASECRKLLKN